MVNPETLTQGTAERLEHKPKRGKEVGVVQRRSPKPWTGRGLWGSEGLLTSFGW